jgi:hypothetical protein
MERMRTILGLAVVAAVVAACGDAGAPTGTREAVRTAALTGGQNDTSTGGGVPALVRISGRVLMASGAQVAGPDSMVAGFVGVPGATVTVMHNIMVNGQSAQELAARVTSGADGAYRIPDLPGGPYVVYADPPAGANLRSGLEYVPLQQAQPTVNVYLGAGQ